jgi:transglutaminase-like putative cysteine protease
VKPERRFRRIILLTALTGHLAYSIAAEKPGLALVGVLASFLSAWLVRQALDGKPRPLPRALLNGLVLAAIAHLALQLLGRTQEVISSLTDFLAYVMLVKSLDRARMRDEAQLLGLSLFVVIGALLTGQSLGMGLALLAYTPLAITSTVSLQLYHALERQHDLLRSVGLEAEIAAVNAQLERQRSPRATAAVAAFCVVASMGAGVFAFIITPRQLAQQLGIATAPFLKTPTTGFTETIMLGGRGNISQDDTPIMDVRVISGPGVTTSRGQAGPIYLRGAILTQYEREHGTWTGDDRDRAPRAGPRVSGQFDRAQVGSLLIPNEESAHLRSQYEIIQRNAKNDSPLFAPLHPVAVSALATDPRSQIVYTHKDGLLRLSHGNGGRISYTVTSATDYLEPGVETGPPSPALPPGAPDEFDPKSVDKPGPARQPTDEFGPRIKQLAASIMADRHVDTTRFDKDPMEVRRAAQAVVTYLATYSYTLEQVPPPSGVDPIEMFLFDTKRGHCEYFSAAMTALLRSVGVPARIATGFAAAEFNGVSGYYTVRQSDAHAWVEVRMTPERWETFDPTPPGELQSTRRASAGPIGWIKHLWDAIEFSWLDNVVAYDKGIKLDVLGLAARTDPGAAALRWQTRLGEIQAWIRRHLPEGVLTRSLIVGVVTFGFIMGAYWLVRLGGKTFVPLRLWLARFMPGRVRAASAGVPVPVDAAFYRDALHALDVAGHAKPAPVPPLAFAGTLDAAAGDALRSIARLYYRSRFAEEHLSPELQADGHASLADLRAALQPRARAGQRPRT